VEPAGSAEVKKVLVVDDSPDIRRIVRHVLESEGYELREMDSASQLEGVLHEFSPDLILSDVMMPGRDGMAVVKAIRANPSMAAVPVVLMSSKAFEGDKRAALDAGATSYLVKPFQPTQLIRAVRNALRTQTSVKIWGCRGSIAVPERHQGRYGGNTACIDLILPGNRHVIFDAGTGLRGLGNSLVGQSPLRLSLFLTHYHWDHVQGLPFFKPIFIPGNEIHLHGPADSNGEMMELIAGQMGGAFFPISVESFRSSVRFIGLQETTFESFGIQISTLYMLHPGRTLAYRVDVDGRSMVFAPDNELLPEMIGRNLSGEALRLAKFARGASLLIHDCQYSRSGYESRRGWGHSCGEALAAVAAEAGVERTLLFHHDPDHTDDDVDAIHTEFRHHLELRGGTGESEPAREGFTYPV
jgi:CheY-like chemotaxis protein/phosphoribosyl 1,2-cyclic phosphodiesterase